MTKKQIKKRVAKKLIKSPSSRSTKKLSAFTPTFNVSKSRKSSLSPPIQEAIVEGISMWPALLPGCRVHFHAVHPDSVRFGDIVIINGEDRHGNPLLRVHRIIGRVGPLFLEAGDNTFTATLIRADQILGLVSGAQTSNGKALKLKRISEKQLAFRFQFWRSAAHSFMFMHEVKNRLVGNRKSAILWRASVLYRKSFATLGLKIPVLASH